MKTYWRLWVVLIVAVIALITGFGFGQMHAAQILITTVSLLLAALMFVDMVKTLLHGNFGIDLLAITAVVATVAVGEYWAALIVLLMLTGGDALEDYAAHKANSELRGLLAASPTKAHRMKGDQIEEVAAEDVQVGDTLLVRPGEVVAVDGTVLKGESTVDESSLTGESRPVTKEPDASIMSGSVNGDGALTMTATATSADSQYQSIVALVKQSIAQPAPFVRMADRYAVPFTILSYLIAGLAWLISGDPVRLAEVLVVASPCPLILAAPIALVSGMSRTSRNGIVVKSGAAIEKMAAAKTAAFDKTGTITQGVLHVADVVPAAGWAKDDLLLYAAAAEHQSTHILARSLVQTAPADLPIASDVRETTGSGVQAVVNGQTVRVGKAKFAGTTPQSDDTAVYVSVDGTYVGYISFADVTRPEASKTMQRLHQLGVKHLVMISGDRKPIADAVAKEVGIDEVYAEQLPVDKINIIRNRAKDERPVIMVGDGVNDAPSLTAADAGIAMGAHGATAASESADVVILRDDLSKVADAVLISRDTMRIAREAVLIGIAICTILMLIASFGVIPAIIGAMFQEVVDTVTILYALRARNG
ncbi:heavy metal translocating P-type ATPase [Lacticaseibacillus pabuli]|uniref:Cd(2+)-exporting ATPase n=1 Tax=Lacticaseibacillus pabuli TaxID=3025672 RepID=A0ABY7WXJ7_9LACO|nr:heavy metal translocating P-type ATPase [Lacticaseibacillus sp. KACC 23028]WDF83799.1 heavy metal translocating P-type ATPase [Lacticaseibacillus sp. KACC 23028]